MKKRVKLAPRPGLKIKPAALDQLYSRIYSTTLEQVKSMRDVELPNDKRVLDKVIHQQVCSKLERYGFALV